MEPNRNEHLRKSIGDPERSVREFEKFCLNDDVQIVQTIHIQATQKSSLPFFKSEVSVV